MGCDLFSCCYLRWVTWQADREARRNLKEQALVEQAEVVLRCRAPQGPLRAHSEATSSQERGSFGPPDDQRRSASLGSRGSQSRLSQDRPPRPSAGSASSRGRPSWERNSRRPSEEMLEHERRMGELGPLPSIPAVPCVLESPHAHPPSLRKVSAGRPSSPRPQRPRPEWAGGL